MSCGWRSASEWHSDRELDGELTEPGVDGEVLGAEVLRARLVHLDLILGAMDLNRVQRADALRKDRADAGTDVLEVGVDGRAVDVSLAAEELVSGNGPAVVDASRLGLRLLLRTGGRDESTPQRIVHVRVQIRVGSRALFLSLSLVFRAPAALLPLLLHAHSFSKITSTSQTHRKHTTTT